MTSKGGSSSNSTQKPFGRRDQGHKIIIAKDGKITTFNVHPLLAGSIFGVCLILALGYLGATGYLMFRDDLINTTRLQQARLKDAYEDRLAAMRIEIDRITSRQLLDQRSVENKLDRLIGLRDAIDDRERTLDIITAAAGDYDISVPEIAPPPRPKPAIQLSSSKPTIDYSALTGSAYASTLPSKDPFRQALNPTPLPTNPLSPAVKSSKDDQLKTPINLKKIENNLREEERAQLDQLKLLTHKTAQITDEIKTAVRSMGYRISTKKPPLKAGLGGPFYEVDGVDPIEFDNSVLLFEETLAHLHAVKQKARTFPIARPLKAGIVSSSFGRRIDPFLGRYAFHSGLDFKAPKGTAVFATAPGKVIKAQRAGGYGRIVEIQHANGIATRYAHLHRIDVKVGQKVRLGEKIGRVGSTGRSTGPHLHYEIRINETPKNPQAFLTAGSKISKYL